MERSTIRALSVETLDIGLREPFGISGGAQDVARNLLVTVELADGTRGYGEAAPFPAYNGETQEAARLSLGHARTVVLGADARRWRRLADQVAEICTVGAARCAIETAVLDALARHAGLPLWALFGGTEHGLVTDITIPTGSVARAQAAAGDAAARGFGVIKVKVGAAETNEDVERVLAAAAAAPQCAFVLDANGALSVERALDLVGQLCRRSVRIALFEQPVDRHDWEGMRAMTRRAGVPIAADESVHTSADAHRVATERAAHVVNVKPMKSGVVEALRIVEVARAAGLGLMIGGMVESILAMTASACLAAGLGGFTFVDLDTPLFMADSPLSGGFVMHGARIDMSTIRAGHGVQPANGKEMDPNPKAAHNPAS